MALTDAQRAKRYRDKIKMQKDSIGLSPEEARRKINNAQSSYNSTTNCKTIEVYQEAPTIFYFLTSSDKENEYYIIKRVIQPNTHKAVMIPRKPQVLDEQEAREEFELLKKDNAPRWKSIEHYLELAIDFHARYQNKLELRVYRYPINRLSFLLAVDEVLANGYQVKINDKVYFHKGIKNTSEKNRNEVRGIRRQTVHMLANPILPDFSDTEGWSSFIRRILEGYIYAAPKKKIALKTFQDKYNCLLSMIRTLGRFPSIITVDAGTLNFDLSSIYDEVKSSYAQNAESNEPSIVNGKSYQRIELNELELMLDWQWNLNRDVYYTTILGLSTLLRPSELKSLLEDPEAHITEKYYLNYKSKKLITKTLKKTDVARLPNPMLEIVSSIILKHYKPTYKEQDFKKSNRHSYRNDKRFEDYCIRRLRTTGAVMVKYSSTDFDAQTRLGHTTNQMLHNIYAPLLPSIKSPEHFFGMEKITFIVVLDEEEYQISSESSLWDLWLLKNFISHHLEVIKSDQEKVNFKRMCLEAGKEYDRVKSGVTGNVPAHKF
jgi:hypothetical protein